MNILYIACSCSPCNGSEDKIGWNIPIHSAKRNRVVVLTTEDQRKYIESYTEKHPVSNVSFEYVDIPNIYKKLFRGFFFSGRLNIWHRRAFKVAEEICRKEQIDIIHQITPVEFRSIGDYGKIPNVKFVCGPIAGGQAIPEALMRYTGLYRGIEWLRTLINATCKLMFSVQRKTDWCDGFFFANQETMEYLKKCIPEGKRLGVYTDVAANTCEFVCSEKNIGKPIHFLVVGRLVYLKGQAFLMDALAGIPKDMEYICHIVGAGNQRGFLEKQCCSLGLQNRVYFDGQIPYDEMKSVYHEADVLIMPSFREATGSVVMEAMENGLPVITINKFGGATILDEETGWLYDGNSREEYIENLKKAIVECIQNPEIVKQKGKNAQKRTEKYTWEEKVKYYQSIYEKLLLEN